MRFQLLLASFTPLRMRMRNSTFLIRKFTDAYLRPLRSQWMLSRESDIGTCVAIWTCGLGFCPLSMPATDAIGWTPVMGARFRLNLKKGWFVMLKGDAGGFGAGSQQTWQIYTGGGKEFKQRYSMFIGYRHLSVDYRDGGFIYNPNMNGILLGFAIKFK